MIEYFNPNKAHVQSTYIKDPNMKCPNFFLTRGAFPYGTSYHGGDGGYNAQGYHILGLM